MRAPLMVFALLIGGCGARTGTIVVPRAVDAGDELDAVASSDGPREADAPPLMTDAIALCGIRADSGGGACGDPKAQPGLTCCGDALVNLENDPLNCGACGHRCATGEMCSGGCGPSMCAPGCGACQVCCIVPGGRGPSPSENGCFEGPTCPVGCPYCT